MTEQPSEGGEQSGVRLEHQPDGGFQHRQEGEDQKYDEHTLFLMALIGGLPSGL